MPPTKKKSPPKTGTAPPGSNMEGRLEPESPIAAPFVTPGVSEPENMDADDTEKPEDTDADVDLEPLNTMEKLLEKEGYKTPPSQKAKALAKKSGEIVFYSFELGDKGDKHFVNTRQALDFKRDFGDLITKEHKFSSLLRYSNHVKRCKGRTVIAPAAVMQSTRAEDQRDEALSNQIAELLSQSRPVDVMKLGYRTNNMTSIVVATIAAKTQWGGHFWGFKPATFAPVLVSYSSIVPSNDMYIQEALQNMTFGKARDEDSPDRNQAKVVNYTPPGKKDVILIDVYVMYTMFTIPHNTMNTAAEEGVWIKDMGEKLLREIRSIMQTPIFKNVLARMGQAQFIEKLFDNRRKSNLLKYLSGCVLQVNEVPNFTDEVIQEVSNKMVMAMYDASLQMRKYPEENLDAALGDSADATSGAFAPGYNHEPQQI